MSSATSATSVRQLSVVFLLVGAGLALWAWGRFGESRSANDWPSVQGRVVSSQVDRRPGTADSKGRFNYAPLIRYGYTVDGRDYESDRYAFKSYTSRGPSGGPPRVRSIVRDHPDGSEVEVFYDPDDPSQAVLARDVDGFALGLSMLGFLVAAVGGYNLARPRSGIVPAFIDFGKGIAGAAYRSSR